MQTLKTFDWGWPSCRFYLMKILEAEVVYICFNCWTPENWALCISLISYVASKLKTPIRYYDWGANSDLGSYFWCWVLRFWSGDFLKLYLFCRIFGKNNQSIITCYGFYLEHFWGLNGVFDFLDNFIWLRVNFLHNFVVVSKIFRRLGSLIWAVLQHKLGNGPQHRALNW